MVEYIEQQKLMHAILTYILRNQTDEHNQNFATPKPVVHKPT